MKFLKVLFALELILTCQAFAGDHWDTCVSKDGKIEYVEGSLFIDGIGYSPQVEVKVIDALVISDVTETCVLENSKKEVISFHEVVSIETIEWILNKMKFSVQVDCKRGGSGIPAGDACIASDFLRL